MGRTFIGMSDEPAIKISREKSTRKISVGKDIPELEKTLEWILNK